MKAYSLLTFSHVMKFPRHSLCKFICVLNQRTSLDCRENTFNIRETNMAYSRGRVAVYWHENVRDVRLINRHSLTCSCVLLSWLPKLDYQPSIGTTAWGRSVSSYYTKTERQNKLINPMNDDMNIKYKKTKLVHLISFQLAWGCSMDGAWFPHVVIRSVCWSEVARSSRTNPK